MSYDDVWPKNKRKAPSAGRSCLKSVIFVLVGTTLVILLLTLGIVYLQVVQITTPQRDTNIGTLPGLTYQDVTLTTADGLKLSTWYVPGTRPDAIVIVHGIHANRGYLIPQTIILAQ